MKLLLLHIKVSNQTLSSGGISCGRGFVTSGPKRPHGDQTPPGPRREKHGRLFQLSVYSRYSHIPEHLGRPPNLSHSILICLSFCPTASLSLSLSTCLSVWGLFRLSIFLVVALFWSVCLSDRETDRQTDTKGNSFWPVCLLCALSLAQPVCLFLSVCFSLL